MEHGLDFVNMLRGMFSFVLYDKNNKRYIAVRVANTTQHSHKPFALGTAY